MDDPAARVPGQLVSFSLPSASLIASHVMRLWRPGRDTDLAATMIAPPLSPHLAQSLPQYPYDAHRDGGGVSS